MNKKNLMHLLAAMLVATLNVGLVSCSSDDDEQKATATLTLGADAQKSLMGTWGLIRVEPLENSDGESGTTFDPLNPTSRNDQKWIVTSPAENRLTVTMYVWDAAKTDWTQTFSVPIVEKNLDGYKELYIDLPDNSTIQISSSGAGQLRVKTGTTRMTFKSWDRLLNTKDLVGTWGLTHSEGLKYSESYDPENPPSEDARMMVITNPSGNTFEIVMYEWDEFKKDWVPGYSEKGNLDAYKLTVANMIFASVSATELVVEIVGEDELCVQTYKRMK